MKRLAKDFTSPVPMEKLMGESPRELPLSIALQIAKVQRVVFTTQPGMDVPVVVLRPGPEGGAQQTGILVAVDDRGKEALASDPVVVEALKRVWMVWAIDPRGIGELETQKPGWVFAVSLLLGENFVWRQGWDIRRIVEFAADSTATHRVGLYARGHNAALAATYAVAAAQGPAPEWAALRNGFVSFRQFLERPRSMQAAIDREIPYEYFVFGALHSFDLPQLLAKAKAKTFIVDPIDGDWDPMAAGPGLTTLDQFLRSDW
jgi:hypothetical protein